MCRRKGRPTSGQAASLDGVAEVRMGQQCRFGDVRVMSDLPNTGRSACNQVLLPNPHRYRLGLAGKVVRLPG
jgi:hypothetical protein